jgi:hypothetical protein
MTSRWFGLAVASVLAGLAVVAPSAAGMPTGPAAGGSGDPAGGTPAVDATTRPAGNAGTAGMPPAGPGGGAGVAAITPPPGITVGPPPGGPGGGVPAAPAATSPAPSDDTSGGGAPGFFDVAGRFRQAINDWFADLLTSGLSPAFDLLGQTVLTTPPVTESTEVRDLWSVSRRLVGIVLVLFVVIGGAIVMGHETLQTRYAAKDIAPRVMVGVVAANASLAIAGQAIAVANGLARAFLGDGLTPAEATTRMKTLVETPLQNGGMFLILLGLVAAGLTLVLLVVYVARVALVVLLVAAAPLALAGHVLPQTDGAARLWWRAFAACLAVQVAQALVLVAALRVFFGTGDSAVLGLTSTGGLVNVVVVICLLWVMIRIPSWASRAVFSTRTSPLARAATQFVIARVRPGGGS